MADSGHSNYAKIGTDGSVLFEFDGHVKAQGLDLDVAGLASTDDQVRWLNTMGVAVASIKGYVGGGLYLQSGPIGSAAGQLSVDPDGAYASAPGPAYSRTIIDSSKRSSFPQLAAPADLRVAADVQTINVVPGNPMDSTDYTLPHTLGRTPAIVIAQVAEGGGYYYGLAVTGTLGYLAGQFNFTLINLSPFVLGAGTVTVASWAIG